MTKELRRVHCPTIYV